MARAEGRPLAGFSADLWKFFDLVNPQAAIQLLGAVGLDQGVACALKSFYAEFGRIMTLNGVAGKKWFAHQSVLQGCAWSNPLTVVLGTLWGFFVEHRAKVAAYTYADDWYVMADRFSLEPEEAPAAANALHSPAPHDDGDLPDPEQEQQPGQPEPHEEPAGEKPAPKRQPKKENPPPLSHPHPCDLSGCSKS